MATALITGATAGIGAEFARAYARRGYDLVLVARDEKRLAAMAEELPSVTVEILRADLADRADVDRVAARLDDLEKPVDILVNNAGFGMHISLLSRDLPAFDRAFEVMVRAVLVLGGAAARSMTTRGHGSIINVGSTAGYIPMGAYSAIKAWVMSYTEGLAVELRGTGVTATVLAPGWVHTEFHDRAGIRKSSVPDALWLQPGPLVETAIRDAAKGKVISLPSLRYKVLIFGARHIPRSLNRWVSRKISSSRADHQAKAVQNH
jgi:short-subunit dehydrogenase